MSYISDKTLELMHTCATPEQKTLLAELMRYRATIPNIRARITALTLAPDLPKAVWSELCLIDSALSLLMGQEPGQ